MKIGTHPRTVLMLSALTMMLLLSGSAKTVQGQLPSILSEGLTLHKETTSTGMMGQGAGTTKATVYFSGMAMRQNSEDGDDVIIRFDQGKIITINHENKTYTEITPEQLQDLINKAAKMSENQEAMEAMQKMMGSAVAQITVSKQGPGENIAGYKTEKYLITGLMQMEVWAAPALKVPATYYDVLKMRTPQNPLFDLGKLYDAFKKIDGITLKEVLTINMMGMTMTSTTVVTSVEKGPIPASTFEVQAGYKLVPFKF
jgi:hypothetical protein